MVKAIEENAPIIGNLTAEKAANLVGAAFSPGAYWEELECTGEIINETFENGLRAPTVPEGEVPSVRKQNYEQKFERMVFSGKTELPMRYSNGRIKKDRHGNVKYETRLHDKTEPKMSFIRKHKLDLTSHPAEWFEAFVPR